MANAQDEELPLKPADTSSPRATLQSFVESMNRMYEVIQADDDSSRSTLRSIYATRATRCLDLSRFDPESNDELGERRAVLLTEIFDRIELPDWDTIPDAAEISQQEVPRWRIPNTDITIEQVADGPRRGEFLFSADTVTRLPEFYELAKHLPYRDGTVFPDAYTTLFNLAPPNLTKATPLKPADTSSPRATLKTFNDNMNALYGSFKRNGLSAATLPERRESSSRAIRTLNLVDVPPTAVDQVAQETLVLLKEVLDRIDLPALEQIPDAGMVEKSSLTRWKIPDTDITISQVNDGPRKGEFLFSPETVDQAAKFYARVEHLPYNEGTVLPDAYHVYLQSPGPLIPISWIMGMPNWLKRVEYGQPVWKWFAVIVVLCLLALELVVAFRIGGRASDEAPRAPFYRRVVFPLAGLLLSYLTDRAIDQIHPSLNVIFFSSVVTTLITSLSLLWLIIITSNGLAESMVATPRINSRGIDAQLVRLVFRLTNLISFVVIILYTANSLGIPLTPVLAGLGVGGLAVALAAQNSLENLIGGINLFTDRPIRVGDFCRFGNRLGTIEEIGLRSTRIRSLDNTVIAIPNSTFSKMELENFSAREKIWYHPRLQLAKTATPDQVRYVLLEVRKMLYGHPKVDPVPARVRFVEFGPSSLDIDIFAYVSVTDYGEYLGIAEDLNLRVMDIVNQAGVSLAVPMQRTLLERVDRHDEQAAEKVQQQVQQWRDGNQLYLPSFPDDVVEDLRNSLEFPPKGSPPS